MGKTYTAKTPPGDFEVTTPENPLLSKQAVTSKGIPICDLITNLRKMLAAKFFNLSHDEDHKVSWSQNPNVYKHSSFFRRMMN